MHELSLAGGILKVLEQTRARDPFERVTQLRLEVGALAGVEIESLRFALTTIATDTLLAGASIEIYTSPATAWCLPCGQSVAITSISEARGQELVSSTSGCPERPAPGGWEQGLVSSTSGCPEPRGVRVAGCGCERQTMTETRNSAMSSGVSRAPVRSTSRLVW